MAYQVGKRSPKKTKPSYIYSIISISLVLFMLGVLGVVVIYAQQLSAYFKENIEVSLILKDNINEADVLQLEKKLGTEEYVKSAEYISKQRAAESFTEEYDEDFVGLLGYNPLYASIDLYLKADYANPDSLKWIKAELEQNPVINEVYYQESLVKLINKNIRNIGLIILAVSILLFLITITLIDSTIRLAMYSNRFLVRSMQLVGARRWFITRPFMSRGILNGFISGTIAVIGLVLLVFYIQQQMPDLVFLQNWLKLGILFAVLIGIGVLISWWSTMRAVQKYLRMKLDELY